MQHKIAGGGHEDLGDEKKEPSVCEREEGRFSIWPSTRIREDLGKPEK
jgi:hypothetical protein